MKQIQTSPIGVLDSGLGGLTVLKSLTTAFPSESFIYYGDTARAPYGDKTKDDLFMINTDILNFMKKKNVKLLVVACNTSAATVYPAVLRDVDIPYVELISHGGRAAAQKTRNKKIAILGTTRTIESQAYQSAVLQYDPNCDILSLACPELVPIVEKGLAEGPSGRVASEKILDQVQVFGADTLIFGCSHYPFFKSLWETMLPTGIQFINPADEILEAVLPYTSHCPDPSLDFHITGSATVFNTFKEKLFK